MHPHGCWRESWDGLANHHDNSAVYWPGYYFMDIITPFVHFPFFPHLLGANMSFFLATPFPTAIHYLSVYMKLIFCACPPTNSHNVSPLLSSFIQLYPCFCLSLISHVTVSLFKPFSIPVVWPRSIKFPSPDWAIWVLIKRMDRELRQTGPFTQW